MITATFALLMDGSTVEIRPAGPQDADAVREMHAALSPENAYLRFFSLSPVNAEREAQRVCREPGPDHVALLAWLDGELAGVASYELIPGPGSGEGGGMAEIAFAVPDRMHGLGIATLLLEHLVSIARQRRVEAFIAEVLTGNRAMLAVFASAGLQAERKYADGDVVLTFPLPCEEAGHSLDSYLDSVDARASHADVASLRHLLAPTSIAVIGAGRRGTPGREILHNIVTGGFGGQVYAVSPCTQSMEGLRCLPSVADLPGHVDLAVIAVPATTVSQVAAACGHRGVRSLLVVTSGLGSGGADLLAICRRHGMRLAGPHAFGVAVPRAGLDATLGASFPLAGEAGVVVQSGGVGVALLAQLSRLGIGVSSFAAVGDKYDVSSNDLLTWWEQDGETRLAVLYVESFGSPREFARTARRVGRRMPVLTVIGGRSAAGQLAAAAHTAAPAVSLVTQEGLFAQAGIVATHSLGELVEAAALLASQPLPAGNRVAIVSNAGGPAVLAADACADHGLRVATLSGTTQRGLRSLLPDGATVTGPVDMTPVAGADAFRSCLEQVAADDGVDAVLAVAVPTAFADLAGALRTVHLAKPLAVALLDQGATVQIMPGHGEKPAPADGGEPDAAQAPWGIPAYAYPEAAARALGHAARYRDWRDREQGEVPEFGDVRAEEARALVDTFLLDQPAGGWLPTAKTGDLLSCYGVRLARKRPGGVKVRVRVTQEPVFGPVVTFGPGGTTAGVPREDAARLTPLTDADADSLIRDSQAAPLLLGEYDGPPMDTTALAGVLLRVSRLADDLPEVAELDLNPVIARPDGVCATAGRIRISPAQPQDPFLRRLR
jgi:acyl-CoA synthetase (NDP forming)/GNAT superfamily N-acetyltransferase